MQSFQLSANLLLSLVSITVLLFVFSSPISSDAYSLAVLTAPILWKTVYNISTFEPRTGTFSNVRPFLTTVDSDDTIGPMLYSAVDNSLVVNHGENYHHFFHYSLKENRINKLGGIVNQMGFTRPACFARDDQRGITWTLSYDFLQEEQIVVAVFYKYADGQYTPYEATYRINLPLGQFEGVPVLNVCTYDYVNNYFFFAVEYPAFLFTIDLAVGEIKYFAPFPAGQVQPQDKLLISLAYSRLQGQLYGIVATGGGLKLDGLYAIDPSTGDNSTIFNSTALKVTWYQLNAYNSYTDEWFLFDFQEYQAYQLLDMSKKVSVANGILNGTGIFGMAWIPDTVGGSNNEIINNMKEEVPHIKKSQPISAHRKRRNTTR